MFFMESLIFYGGQLISVKFCPKSMLLGLLIHCLKLIWVGLDAF